MDNNILSIRNLQIEYKIANGYFRAINHINLDIFENEVFGIVGESGSGKSTLCNGFLRLLPGDTKVNADSIEFDGQDILNMQNKKFNHIRWEQISYIPQSAMNTMNPIQNIRKHFYETIEAHEGRRPNGELYKRTADALKSVSLDPSIADKYAHELSGGMKQRVCIALAMLLSPKLIVADEPTSALDVISQRSVLQILMKVRENMKASMIMIGHDMALQAQVANRIGIMYAGYFVEIGSVDEIFKNPIHPYTKSLIKSIPSIRKKEDISVLTSYELTQRFRDSLRTPGKLNEVSSGHFVADYIKE